MKPGGELVGAAQEARQRGAQTHHEEVEVVGDHQTRGEYCN
jgi:hypothetical protein